MATFAKEEPVLMSARANGMVVELKLSDGTSRHITRREALTRAQALIGMSPIWEEMYHMLVDAASAAYRNQHKTGYSSKHLHAFNTSRQDEIDRLRGRKRGLGV